jgi:xylono-1,5-lactonase
MARNMAGMTKAELWIKAEHRLGESIIWHVAMQRLMWVDLLDPALFIHDPRKNETARHGLDLPPPIGSIAATTDPTRLILAHRGGLSLLNTRTMALESYCNPEDGRDEVIYNDIKVDRWGRLWVGTSHAKEAEPRGALWCVTNRETFSLADVGFPVSNGPAFSRDGSTMIFNDSANYKSFAYDIAEQEMMARHRRVLRAHAVSDGMPDGVVVDSEDTIWTAQWGGAAVLALSPVGALLRKVEVPAWNVTTLCFAGPDLRDVYITTATDTVPPEKMVAFPLTGSLFHFRADVPGLEEPLFAI